MAKAKQAVVRTDSLGNIITESTIFNETRLRGGVGWSWEDAASRGDKSLLSEGSKFLGIHSKNPSWSVVRDAGLAAGYEMPDVEPLGTSYTVKHPAGLAAQAARDTEWLDAAKVYIRYGSLPKSGKSMNFRDNITEKGVSVFNGEVLQSGKYRVNLSDNPGSIFATDRPAYIVSGKQIGIGSDGEPVLENAKIVARLDEIAVKKGGTKVVASAKNLLSAAENEYNAAGRPGKLADWISQWIGKLGGIASIIPVGQMIPQAILYARERKRAELLRIRGGYDDEGGYWPPEL
jgi:hypothetical protein